MTKHKENKYFYYLGTKNRREFYRAGASLDVFCRPISEREQEWMLKHNRRPFPKSVVSSLFGGEKGVLKGELVDVGGGGMKFTCNDAPEEGSFVELAFEVPGPEPKQVLCVGRVMRVEELQECKSLAVEFTYIRESDRDRIVGLTFHPPEDPEAEESSEPSS